MSTSEPVDDFAPGEEGCMIALAAAERMYGRRARSRSGDRVHAIRNDAFGQLVVARCEVRVGTTVGQDQAATCPQCLRLLAADAAEANAPYAERIAAAEAGIAAAGFRLRYVDACEGDGVGGLIGLGVGVTSWDRREIRIRKMLTGASVVEVLEHELAHAEERPGFERGTHTLFAEDGAKPIESAEAGRPDAASYRTNSQLLTRKTGTR